MTLLRPALVFGGFIFLAVTTFAQQPAAYRAGATSTANSPALNTKTHAPSDSALASVKKPSASDSAANKPPAPPDMSVIQHVVFIVKENRTFDNYFGTYPGANGATTGVLSTGQTIPLGHQPDLSAPWDINHGWGAALTAMDGGKMDRFDLNDGANVNGNLLAYTQVTQQDIPNYFTYAQNFVLGDNMFSSIHASSFSNHLYIVAAQSNGALDINQPNPVGNPAWGCDSPATFDSPVMDQYGNVSNQFPCWDFTTLADNLSAANISWGFYAPPEGAPGHNFSTLDAINHIRYGPLWQYVYPDTQFVTDAAGPNLPAVSWVATGVGSEHPDLSSICVGEGWTVDQVNAIMSGPNWNSTAIFIVWDDFGGMYDHMTPPGVDTFGLGPRVPFLIISPYVIPGYISHTQYEFGSVLKFIEERFGLPPLTLRDANANDTTDSFNFATNSPNPPLILTPRTCPIPSASVIQFGGQAVGTTTPAYTLTLSNYGTAILNVSKIQPAGDFAYSGTCPKIKPGGVCKLKVTFTPKATGTRTGTLTITDSDASSPQVVTLQGTGSDVYLPIYYPGLTFPTRLLGTTSPSQSVTLTNKGNTPLAINSVTTIGAFTQTNNCGGSVAAGGNCVIKVKFAPTAATALKASPNYIGNLIINDNDPASPQTVRMKGAGTGVSLNPTSLNFGSQSVGTSSNPLPVTLTNAGVNTLTFATIVASGDFSETDNCTGGVLPNGTCTINVVFTPSTIGTLKGTLTLNDSDISSPQLMSLTGTGQ